MAARLIALLIAIGVSVLALILVALSGYPRDRVSAIRTPHDLGLITEAPPADELYPDDLAVRRSGRPPGS
jgi:hypothetical protein